MMAGESSSSSKSTPSVSQKDLLNFYQKKYEEGQRKDDKYKEKVDKHIKNLVTDRYELEEEVLRRGEKIADLQKALVELQLSVFEERERFLKVSSENEELQRNKEQLHENIRQLLLMTHQQDLRDRIIYILQDPKVDTVCRTSAKSGKSGGPAQEVIANQKLKEELDSLKRQLDEVLQVSKSKSDSVLEDCKKALEKSKEKILQDERVIGQLQRKLQELKDLERKKSSVAAAKSSSSERHRSVGKSISADRQNFVKDNYHEALDLIETTQSIFAERLPGGSVPVNQKISRERLNSEKNSSQELLNAVAATHSISEERARTVPLYKGIERQVSPTTARGFSNEMLHSVAATKKSSAERPIIVDKTISADRQRSARIAKSVSWENYSPLMTATENRHTENRHTENQSSTDSEVLSNLCSLLKDIHLSFILLTKIVSKIENILNSIQTTKLYHRFARIPKAPTDLQHHVVENDVLQLELSLRQCTRLTFDISNMCQSALKHVDKTEVKSIQPELKHLEKTVKEMSIMTADNDLLNLGLKRSGFFQALRDSSAVVQEINRLQHLDDFKKIVKNCEILSKNITEATDFVESVVEKCAVKKDFCEIVDSLKGFSHLSSETYGDRFASKLDRNGSLKQAKSKSLQDLKKLVNIYKRTVQDSESLGLSTEKLSERIKSAEKILQEEERRTDSETYFDEIPSPPDTPKDDGGPSDCEDILRNINKTLSKVKRMEQGRYFKDEEVCRKLAENVSALTEQFKELTQDYNVKSFQNQFSEYSKVTLSKLEELAKQCKNSVIAAEAQIAAHRSNAKNLSEKLKETEELLRESINECLSLKQKFKQTEAEHEMEKYRMISTLKDRLEKHTSSTQGVEEVIDELVSNFPAYETIKTTPFICMYCRYGPGHKHCEEKIKELTAECRKFRTQLKLLKQDTDQEKMTLKNHNEVAESSLTDLKQRNEAMKQDLEMLQKRTASLLEQLKVEKNRVKNMERHQRLEIEGFQTDIKMQKAKIKDLEKQLLKAVLLFENNHKDLEMLKAVHETAERSVQAVGYLRRLKAKLYQLETDMKSL